MMGSLLRLAVSPVRYYRERLEGPARWTSPVLALLCNQVLLTVVGAMTLARSVSPVSVEAHLLYGALFLVSVVFLFAFQMGVVVGLGLLSPVRKASRLVELSVLAYWTQVPMGAIAVIFWAVVDLEPVGVPPDAGFMAIGAALEESNRSAPPAVATLQLIATYWSLWVVALQAAALRVVSGFTAGGAAAAGCLLGLLFVVLPWVVSRL